MDYNFCDYGRLLLMPLIDGSEDYEYDEEEMAKSVEKGQTCKGILQKSGKGRIVENLIVILYFYLINRCRKAFLSRMDRNAFYNDSYSLKTLFFDRQFEILNSYVKMNVLKMPGIVNMKKQVSNKKMQAIRFRRICLWEWRITKCVFYLKWTEKIMFLMEAVLAGLLQGQSLWKIRR